jgi:hypothetical protein
MSRGSLSVPLIFVGTESDSVNLAGKMTVVFAAGECDFHGVVVELVAVYDHYRPLSIGPLDSVCGDENVAGSIVDVARGLKLFVGRVDGLYPLFGNDLCR